MPIYQREPLDSSTIVTGCSPTAGRHLSLLESHLAAGVAGSAAGCYLQPLRTVLNVKMGQQQGVCL